MLFCIPKSLQRALWAVSGPALAVLCANAGWANGIITTTRHADGGRLSVQTQTGSNCSASAPDRPSLSVVGGVRDRDYGFGSGGQDTVAGVAFTIPFGGQKIGNCNDLLSIEEARNRIDLAVTLFEAGALTGEEFKAIMAEAKSVLLGP
jgi:hypothetical protein